MVGRQEDRRRHHVASIADTFLTRERRPPSPPTLVVAAPGTAATPAVSAAMARHRGQDLVHDLGDSIGVRIERWEQEGLERATAGSAVVLLWCVRGGQASALSSGLLLGRLAALYEPMTTTVLWLPEHDPVGEEPAPAMRERVRRLAAAAVPRARVTVCCVGWEDAAERELESLAARFA